MQRGSKAPSIAKRSSLAGAQVNTHTHTVALFLVVLACCLKMCMSWLMVSVVMFGGGTKPAMADVKLSAAWMSASAGVSVGMVSYLCLKNTVLQVRVCLV
jgi:hypothetical protein